MLVCIIRFQLRYMSALHVISTLSAPNYIKHLMICQPKVRNSKYASLKLGDSYEYSMYFKLTLKKKQ